MRIVGVSTLGGALALGLLASTLAAGEAHAGSHISVGIGFGFGAPVYAAPYAYAPPPVYYYPPAPAYYGPRPAYWRHWRDDD